jgi:capsule polysaccharide export protein KpsE/RkpR
MVSHVFEDLRTRKGPQQMGTQIHELQEQVEIRDNTIEVLENQLHDLQLELDDAKAHQNASPGVAGCLVGG